MTVDERRLDKTTAALRAAFDRSFAEVPMAERARAEDFLAIRVAGDPYAIRLSDISALHRDRKIVTIPSRAPDLLGIAGFRGMMAPVYDLGSLLGYCAASTPRWLVLSRGRSPVGWAFDLFEAQMRLEPGNISSPGGEEHTRRHVRGAVHADHVVRPLIDIASLLEAIARRAHSDGPP
jgi:chemotaxis signal transduction protein